MRPLRSVTAAALLVGGQVVALAAAGPAAAEPATSVAFPGGSTGTRFSGRAFDTCTAPSIPTLRAWKASPYRAVAVYIGGANRACRQPALTPGWAREATRLGWRVIPVYVGRQAPCSDKRTLLRITPSRARAQGVSAAADAATKAAALGMRAGSALQADIENYDTRDVGCRTAVRRFLSGWTAELHRRGYLAGVYSNEGSGIRHVAGTFLSTSYARTDTVWSARWNRVASLRGWSTVPDRRWSSHQRLKQYRGDHLETWGGVRLDVDSNVVDAAVATVALPYAVTVTGTLNARTAPRTDAPVVTRLAGGSTAAVVCQTSGDPVAGTAVWNRLTDGTYVSDHFVGTPSGTGWTAVLPRCRYPYQVTSTTSVNLRRGPGTSHAVTGSLDAGALAWVVCQDTGGTTGGTKVWNRLDSGGWVSDAFVATPSGTGRSKPLPHC